MKTVNICGIPHKVVEVQDGFDNREQFAKIEYLSATIKINGAITKEIKRKFIQIYLIYLIQYIMDFL